MSKKSRKNTTQFSSRKFNLNLESPPKKSRNSSSSYKYMLFLLLFVVALMGVAVTQNGLTGYVVGVPEWENTKIITANSSTETVIVSITFGENKPEFCSDGIYIETQYNDEVEFSVENETYVNNTCASCNVVFANIIYIKLLYKFVC